MVVTVKRNSKTLIAAIFLIEKKHARVCLDSIAEEGFVVAFWVFKVVMHSCKSVFLKPCEGMASFFLSSVFIGSSSVFSGGGKSEGFVITGYKCLWTLSCVQQLKVFSCSLPNTNASRQ